MNNKIEKQAIPIFFQEDEPIAILCFINRDRILYKVEKMSEEEIISLFENKDKPLKK